MQYTRSTTIMAVVLPLLAVAGAAAQSFEIDWYTIDGGGEMFSTAGEFTLSGTIGQPDAGEMSGGSFALTGGFWFGIVTGDGDGDGDVDLDDYADFEACAAGPGGGLEPGCVCFDFDEDGDVDFADFGAFQIAFTG